MGKTSSLTVELLYKPGEGLEAVLSLPGREGTLSRCWKVGRSRSLLSAPQLEDIRAWVDQVVSQWVLTEGGVQLAFFELDR